MGPVTFDEEQGTFDRAPDFDLEVSLAALPRDQTADKHALIRFDTAIASVAIRQVPGAAVLDEDPSGVLVEVPYSVDRSLIGWVLGFDDKAVIEAPPELRTALLEFVGRPQ